MEGNPKALIWLPTGEVHDDSFTLPCRLWGATAALRARLQHAQRAARAEAQLSGFLCSKTPRPWAAWTRPNATSRSVYIPVLNFLSYNKDCIPEDNEVCKEALHIHTIRLRCRHCAGPGLANGHATASYGTPPPQSGQARPAFMPSPPSPQPTSIGAQTSSSRLANMEHKLIVVPSPASRSRTVGHSADTLLRSSNLTGLCHTQVTGCMKLEQG